MFNNIKKAWKIFAALVVFLFLIFVLSRGHIYEKDEIEYGVTFSAGQAESLGLNWQEVFGAMLSDLGIKKIRLSAYWNEIEKNPHEYSWDKLDWQIEKASEANAEIILSIGGRLPRWPECHFPSWAGNLEKSAREKEILEYIQIVISRYQDNKNIIAWQIENEPFLSHFGNCPELDKSFLDQEITLAHALDLRPVVVTDSGELSVWVPAAKRADIFGTTMYRDTYSEIFKRYIHYPIGPGFFRFKKNVASFFAHPKKWIVIELQAEPWGPKPFQNLSSEERGRTMNLQKFKEIIEFARLSGFRELYFWGVEWWYWEKTKQNNPALWEEARGLFK